MLARRALDIIASTKRLARKDSIELELVVDILLLDLGVRRNVD
jgi:hypothetical protein